MSRAHRVDKKRREAKVVQVSGAAKVIARGVRGLLNKSWRTRDRQKEAFGKTRDFN